LILEICAYNIQSCLVAQQAGASRIELCADPLQGGTTPSIGLLQYVREHIFIPVFPMIRPRGGNFIYNADELAIMEKDIIAVRQLGFPGIATGVQQRDGTIHTEALKRLVEAAGPMAVTCHKVFDTTPDAFAALESVIDAGCSRILTSGLQKTAVEGAAVLAQLIERANGLITIMPGGGVRSSNIAELVRATGAAEYHSSALVAKAKEFIADENEVKELVSQLKRSGA